jgi:hypothetical protein
VYYLLFEEEKSQPMSKFQEFLKQFTPAAQVTNEEIEKTKALLPLYAPTIQRVARNIGDMEDECQERRSQTVVDFVNLCIDYERDTDRKRITERLAGMGYSMQYLTIMENAFLLLKNDTSCSKMYYEILRTRYFDAYCRSNEDAYLTLGISSATYYRNIGKAIRVYAGYLWCVVIPDLVQSGQRNAMHPADETGNDSRMRAK